MALITTWADKGQSGKSTLVASAAYRFGWPVVNLDPHRDIERWAQRLQHPCHYPETVADARRVLADMASKPTPVLVDTPHGVGEDVFEALRLSSVVVMPTGPGEPARAALVRALDALHEHAPQAKVAVFLNNFRSNVTDHQNVDASLILYGAKRGFTYLGNLGNAAPVERILSAGADPMKSGATAHQMRRILTTLETLI